MHDLITGLFTPVYFKKLHQLSVTPKKAHDCDAGFDLTAVSVELDKWGNYVYGTGIAISIPNGYVGLLFPRSSVSTKDLSMCNCVGVIDSGYVGEVSIKFSPINKGIGNLFATTYKIGDRVGQLVILKLPNIELVEVSELDSTKRGSGGFGSSGA